MALRWRSFNVSNNCFMDWINLHTKVLDSPEVVGAEPVDRGTWLMLLRYCIGQENGGRIEDCAGWKDRKWQQLARVTLAEVRRETDLWAWDGKDLVVWGYPADKEREVQVKREIARHNGKQGGRPVGGQLETNVGSKKKPTSVNSEKAEGERKGKEEQRKVKEGEAAAAAAKTNAQLAEMLCLAHPSKALTGPALAAALDALKRHLFEDLLGGTVAYAEAVAGWTEGERIQFVKNPEAFFREDIWRQPAENWRSRIAARREAANGSGVRSINVGGRKPSGVYTAHLEG